jgi:hypothetical protein
VSASRVPLSMAEFDVIGIAVGAALVSGALAVVGPPLAALTGALAVLAWAGWVALVRQTPGPVRRLVTGTRGWAAASAGAGALLFAAGPGFLAPFRGLVLAFSLVPLWWVARRFPGPDP